MLAEEALAQLGPEGRELLLRLRPDLADPPASSPRELARRAVEPASLAVALRSFDTPTMQVTEVLAALGDRADRERLERLLGIRPGSAREGEAVDEALATLRAYLFLAPGHRPRLLPEIARAWPRPLDLDGPLTEILPQLTADVMRSGLAALGVPTRATRKADLLTDLTRALTDPAVVRKALAGAEPAIRQRLVDAAFGSPLEPLFGFYVPRSPELDAARWAIERCFAFQTWEGTFMPAEVALAIRDEGWHLAFDPEPPPALWSPRDEQMMRREVGAAAGTAVRIVTGLVESSRRRPIPRIKSGAVGIRELRRLAKELDAGLDGVRLALALATELALVAPGPRGVEPTREADDWLHRSPGEQATALVAGWLTLFDVATLATDEPWYPAENQRAADARAATLGILLTHSGEATDTASLAAQLRWRFPVVFGNRLSAVRTLVRADGTTVSAGRPPVVDIAADEDEYEEYDDLEDGPDDDPAEQLALVSAVLAEAAWLGLVADGAVTPVGVAALTEGLDVARAYLDGALGGATTTAQLQADLTAVVLGHPAAELTRTLDAFATRETRSVASTWRFTPTTVREALDAGWEADDVLAQLTLVADGHLPQPLTYLVRDVARRHGHLRAGEAACYLRGDDEALLREVAADRRLAALGLRLIGGVVVGARPLDETLAALRRAGYAPVHEGPDGERIVSRPDVEPSSRT